MPRASNFSHKAALVVGSELKQPASMDVAATRASSDSERRNRVPGRAGEQEGEQPPCVAVAQAGDGADPEPGGDDGPVVAVPAGLPALARLGPGLGLDGLEPGQLRVQRLHGQRRPRLVLYRTCCVQDKVRSKESLMSRTTSVDRPRVMVPES